MRDDARKLGFVLRRLDQPAIDVSEAAGQREGVDILHINDFVGIAELSVLELRRNRFGQPLPDARDVSLRRTVIQQGHLAFRLLRRLLAELHVFVRL